MERSYTKGTWQEKRAFSPIVTTKGGTVHWVAGHTGALDDDGNSLAGNFDAQVHQTFKSLQTTLDRVGATLQDIVTMTVFLADSRHSTQLTEIRQEYYPTKDFPASALITVDGFVNPDFMIEIQCIAVVDGD